MDENIEKLKELFIEALKEQIKEDEEEVENYILPKMILVDFSPSI